MSLETIKEALEDLKQLEVEKPFKGYIYKITNKINGKFYIGKTKYTIAQRYYHHLWACNHYNDSTSAIHNAIRQYGQDNFEIIKIDEADSLEELNEKEKYWIKELDAQNPTVGYNIAKGGEGGVGGPMFAGHKHSIETRMKMSADRRGDKNSNFDHHRVMPEEEKIKHANRGERNGMYGKTQSDSSKDKNRQKHSGKLAYSNIELNKVIMLTPEEGAKLIAENPEWFQGNIHARMFTKDK